jgi:hypothetical protein
VVEHREEESEALSEGDTSAAAAALMTREEGRRLDILLDTVVRGLTTAVGMYEKMCSAMLARTVEDGKVLRELLAAHRQTYLENTELHADAILAQAEREAEESGSSDTISRLAEMFAPAILAKAGVALPTAKPPRRQAKSTPVAP